MSQGTSGYIINTHYVPILLKTYNAALAKLRSYFAKLSQSAGSRVPSYAERDHATKIWPHIADVAWQPLQESGHWVVHRERLGTQLPGMSDIEHSIVDYTARYQGRTQLRRNVKDALLEENTAIVPSGFATPAPEAGSGKLGESETKAHKAGKRGSLQKSNGGEDDDRVSRAHKAEAAASKREGEDKRRKPK